MIFQSIVFVGLLTTLKQSLHFSNKFMFKIRFNIGCITVGFRINYFSFCKKFS